MKSQIISLIGWRFLPDIATGWIQNIYYSVNRKAGKPKPAPGSLQYNVDRRRIYITVVSVYLMFTIYMIDREIRQEGHFFHDLKLSESATDREIKTRFRRLAALHHPDKIAIRSSSPESSFVQLKLAQDILLDPVKRFAYERFGPAMLEWERCSNVRDYLAQGMKNTLPSYGGMAIAIFFLGYFGYANIGYYWRWLIFTSLCVFELHTLASPHLSPLLTKVINPILKAFTDHPPYLPFQMIKMAHQVFVAINIALSQLGPFFTCEEDSQVSEAEINKKLESLEMKVKSIEAEASRLLDLEMTPFLQGTSMLDLVEGKMKDWLIQNTIKMDPEVRDTICRIRKEKSENQG